MTKSKANSTMIRRREARNEMVMCCLAGGIAALSIGAMFVMSVAHISAGF